MVSLKSARAALVTWATFHARALLGTAGQLLRAPATTLLTAAVVGIALALPLGLFVVVHGLTLLAERWDRDAQLSVFLAPTVTDREAHDVAESLLGRPEVGSVRVLGRSEVIEDFERITGLSGVGPALGSDPPLPAVLLVNTPGRLTDAATRPALQALAAELQALPAIDSVEFDTEWLSRLHTVLAVLRRAVGTLSALLAVGLLLTTGNVVRVMVERRREEIAVARLCGATDGFVRRPFLYSGALLGILGALFGWGALKLGGAAMAGPLETLAEIYPGAAHLPALGLGPLAALTATGAILGWAGAWLAAGRELRRMEP